MPTYEYSCECGKVTDFVCRIAERPEQVLCPKCGRLAKFIISAPQIRVDTIQDTPWLRDFAKTRKEARFGGKPIETRTEYRQYMKDHDLRHCDGENLSQV